MSKRTDRNEDSPLGDISSPAPSPREWSIGLAAALALHLIAAAPFLPEPSPPPVAEAGFEGPELGVRLAPMIRPPDATAPQAPAPEEESKAIEERASNSPPPAPPAKPREIPNLPDIRPRAVPDIWLGDGSGGGGGLTLDEYVQLKSWLESARRKILESLVYPEEALKLELSGNAEVLIVADRNGRILSWTFRKQTGYAILDREIARSIDSIGRLPKFPEGTKHPSLSFIVPIRFEVVDALPRGGAAASQSAGGAASAPARSTPASQPEDMLSVAQMRQCADSAAELAFERGAIERKRAELEAIRAEYEKKAKRYERDGTSLPISVRKLLKDYNSGIEEYDAMIEAFQAKAHGFSAMCGSGSTNWDNYVLACGAYRMAGNSYCEAFGELWMRLSAK